MNSLRPSTPQSQLQFLQDLVEQNASIDGYVLQVGEQMWVVHGYIPVDCDVLMAEFDSYDEATAVLGRLPRRSKRIDDVP